MPLSDKGSRKLPYPLNKTLEPIGDTPNETVDYTTVLGFPDETTRVNITLNLSLDEYVALATAIDVGRDIAFAEDSELIWHTWVRAFREGTVMACEDVADCIETELVTNQTLINQLTETINASGFGNVNRVNPYLTKISDRNNPDFATTEVAELEDCNLDKLWGGIRHGIVDRLDEVLADTLEDISAIPTIIGKNAAWLDIIPVLGDLAEAVVTSLSSVTPTLLSLFAAHSSEATKDEIACDLFGMVCSECRYPNYQEIYDYFKNFALPATPGIGEWVLDTMTQLLTNPVGVTAKVAYFTLMCWQLGILYLQATFAGNTGSSTIFKFAKLGEDFNSNNWLDLCDSCNETYAIYTLDFSTGLHDSYKDGVTVTGAVYIAGEGWRAGVYGAGKRADICIKFDPAWKIRGVGMQIEGATPSSQIFYRRPTWQSNTGVVSPSAGSACGDYTKAWDGYAGVSGYNEILFFWQGGASDIMTLKKITIICDNGFAPPTAIPTTDSTVC